jgi:flagellin-like protein
MRKNISYSKNKKGLSEIVSVIIIILLVISLSAIVWGVVNKLVKDKTEQISSCFDADFSNSVLFNNDYTCFDSSLKEMQFSLEIGDLDIDKVVISISYGGSSRTFTLTNEDEIITNIFTYPSRQQYVSLPGRNSGKTYIVTEINAFPDWIKVVPYVNGKQCETSDTINNPYDCDLFIQ